MSFVMGDKLEGIVDWWGPTQGLIYLVCNCKSVPTYIVKHWKKGGPTHLMGDYTEEYILTGFKRVN